MIWWLITLALFLGSLLLVQDAIPPSWYPDVFQYSRWGASFWVAIVGVLSGWLLTQLQHLLDAGKNKGWRVCDSNAQIVHRVRVRIVFIIVTTAVLTALLLSLPVAGPKLPEEFQSFAAGLPFAAIVVFMYILISILVWMLKISKVQRQFLKDAQIENDRKALLVRIGSSKIEPQADKQDEIDGHI